MSDYNEEILDSNLIEEQEAPIESVDTEEDTVIEELQYEEVLEDNPQEENPDSENVETNEETSDEQPEVNCLALTIKKDYSISIIKNKIKKVVKSSWKVAVSIFVLNFLSSFL